MPDATNHAVNRRLRGLARAFVLLSAAVLPGWLAAADTVPGPVPARVVHVVDGDTLVVRAHIWLGQEVETLVRVAGVDAPELKGACARERERAQAARDYVVARALGETITLVGIRYEKYGGRVLAQVRLADGRDLAAALVADGHARAYDGRARAGWCEEAASPEPKAAPEPKSPAD